MSAVNTIHLIKRGKVWVPADAHAEEFTDKRKDDTEEVFQRISVKSPKAMRWYFVMLKKVIENTEVYKDTEELRDALLIATGWYTWKRDIYGRRYEVAKSMREMDDDQFELHKQQALRLIESQLGIDAVELMRQADGTQKWVGPLPG